MSHRYVIGSYWDTEFEGETVAPTSIMILEEDNTPIRTGLLDQYGNPIYRVPTRIKVGFQI